MKIVYELKKMYFSEKSFNAVYLYQEGIDQQCMVVELIECSIIEKSFRIPFRPIRRFYGAYVFFSKSANAVLKS